MNPLQLTAFCMMTTAAALMVIIAVSAIIERPLTRKQRFTRRDGWFLLCGAVFFGCEAVSTALHYHGGLSIMAMAIGLIAAVLYLAHQARSLRTPPIEPPQKSGPLHD